VDEDDFRDRPRQRKKPRKEKPAWEKSLLEQLRIYVLREPEDFVIRDQIASELNLTSAAIVVGQCLANLAREGLLVHKVVNPEQYPEVFIGPGFRVSKATWHEGQWIWGAFPIFQHKGFGNYRGKHFGVRRDHRKFRSKKEIAKAQRKTAIVPVKPEQWDGRAYFIIRGREFHRACKAAGVPADPKADWICPQCKASCRYDDLRCPNYGHCEYRRPHDKYWPPPPVQSIVCKRCGVTLPPGKKIHNERVCNEAIVGEVMES